MKLSMLIPLAAIAACNNPTPFDPNQWTGLSESERASAILRISTACSLPTDRVQIEGDKLWIRPLPDDDYQKVDCLLRGARSLKGAKLGFIGNDAVSPGSKEQ